MNRFNLKGKGSTCSAKSAFLGRKEVPGFGGGVRGMVKNGSTERHEKARRVITPKGGRSRRPFLLTYRVSPLLLLLFGGCCRWEEWGGVGENFCI